MCGYANGLNHVKRLHYFTLLARVFPVVGTNARARIQKASTFGESCAFVALSRRHACIYKATKS